MLATVEAPAAARRFVRATLDAWGCVGASEEVREDLVLVVSELVSEATRYPLAMHVEVRLTRRAGRVELIVDDACPEPPGCADALTPAATLVRSLLEGCAEHWDWSAGAATGRSVRASLRF